jgi:hypothetical protein
MRNHPERGSHLPALIKLLQITDGPVWEFGCGMYSTPFLHWACWAKQRQLITFEGQESWLPFAMMFESSYHRIRLATGFKDLDLSGPCSVALVDHDQDGNVRGNEVKRLTHAEYVVLHDANRPDKYAYTDAFPLFKYRKHVRTPGISIEILSNIHDLAGLEL